MEQSPELIHGTGDTSTISDINVTPFIDVMLVLLIIFMITAPLMMGGVRINLPKTSGTPMTRPDHPLIISLDAENRVYVDQEEISSETLKETFRKLAIESESGEVFIKGDGEVRYAKMMELMSELGQAGFARVMLVSNVQQNPVSDSSAPGAAPGEDLLPAASPSPEPVSSAPSAPAAPVAVPSASPSL
jgi:biopolymer transport protein ExbD